MKQRLLLSIKYFLLLFLFLSFGFLLRFFPILQNRISFRQITNKLFAEELTSNTLTMHYTLADPKSFGIVAYEPTLPIYQKDGEISPPVATENLLAALEKIDVRNLTDKDRYVYTLLQRSLSLSLLQSNYLYFGEPFSPYSGVQSQFPILLAEFTLRNKSDIQHYLSLLEQSGKYLDSLLLYEKEKASYGLLMCSSSLEKVRRQCDTIVTKEALESNTHFLQSTFSERLLPLYKEHKITKEEWENFTVQNNRLLKTILLPAYQNLSDGLFLLEDSTIPLAGLANRPNGADYYQVLLKATTGSHRPLEEIRQMLTQTIKAEKQALSALLSKYPDARPLLLDGSYQLLPFSDFPSILSDLQNRMKKDFPALPVSTSSQVSIKPVSSSLESYSAPAFYLTSPVDDTAQNVIYLNKKEELSDLELYTTLAHEGYPGHLYQNVFCSNALLKNKENNIRHLLWYGGYLEGWALYVEFCSYDYASILLEENKRPLDAVCVQIEKHNRSLQLCLFSLLDLMIHHDNASFRQVQKLLDEFGISNDSAAAIYTYLVENPCNYPKYYLGYLEILSLRERAKKLWGASYTDAAFHRFYLDCGSSDFLSLKERLEKTLPPSVS